MVENEINKQEISLRFSQLHWHDSKLLDLCVLKQDGEKKYDIQLTLNLIMVYRQGGGVETSKKRVVFKECRGIEADLDLLGVLICGGAIGSATCYSDAVDFKRRRTNKAGQFDFPESYNPLEKCLAFFIEMINPGGQIIVFARDFELLDLP